MKVFGLTSASRVLDVGFTDHEYVPHENYLEKHYPWPEQLTALGVDEPMECLQRYPKVSFVRYDGWLFPFEDRQFDVAHSNAVLEHVGGRERQSRFVREMLRVARCVWLTTPSRAFPIDVHTLIPFAHWFPARVRDTVYAGLGKSWAAGGYLNLLYRHELESLFVGTSVERCTIVTNRVAFLPLEYVVVVDRRV